MDMSETVAPGRSDDQPRDDWIPREAYISREFAELERENLWRRAWLMACREEDLPHPGSFFTYDILDESVIVVRDMGGRIRAFNNACLHRGRRLTEGCGKAVRLFCRYHGWSWNVDGTNARVLDKGDWSGRLDDADLSLPEFKVGLWGGFVFVNLSDEGMPFDEFAAPLRERLDPVELEKWRYRWYISVEVDANWKTTLEAFQEGYHVSATHPQFHPYLDSRTYGYGLGVHGMMLSAPPNDGFKSDHRPVAESGLDGREAFVEYVRQMAQTFPFYTDRDLQAVARVLTEMPAGTTYIEAAVRGMQYLREAAVASGAGYPEMTQEQASKVGSVWSVFPNAVTVFSFTSGIWYVTRPSRDNDPDKCVMELFALERFTPGAEPPITRKHYRTWQEGDALPSFTFDDFVNIPEVQRGMKTSRWKGARPNPLQERVVSHFHEVLRSFVHGDGRPPAAS
jgi:phenylpropionate dioxygenase-like ring-hydroxylating dioxygenase large terminal subunit